MLALTADRCVVAASSDIMSAVGADDGAVASTDVNCSSARTDFAATAAHCATGCSPG